MLVILKTRGSFLPYLDFDMDPISLSTMIRASKRRNSSEEKGIA
jgi:hypothetical protein